MWFIERSRRYIVLSRKATLSSMAFHLPHLQNVPYSFLMGWREGGGLSRLEIKGYIWSRNEYVEFGQHIIWSKRKVLVLQSHLITIDWEGGPLSLFLLVISVLG